MSQAGMLVSTVFTQLQNLGWMEVLSKIGRRERMNENFTQRIHLKLECWSLQPPQFLSVLSESHNLLWMEVEQKGREQKMNEEKLGQKDPCWKLVCCSNSKILDGRGAWKRIEKELRPRNSRGSSVRSWSVRFCSFHSSVSFIRDS